MLKKMQIFFCVTFITLLMTTNIFAEGNLIQNGSFEEEQGGSPTNWTSHSYIKDEGASEFILEAEGANSGSRCVTVINNVENDSRYIQTISAQPNKKYKLSCYIKAENIGDTGNGAILSVEGQVSASNTLRNTNGKWEYAELYVKTGDDINSFNVTVGVGGYGAMSTGKASFDDVTVEEVDNIPDGSVIAVVERPNSDNSSQDSSSDTEKKSSTSIIVWIVLAVCIIIVAVATYSTFKTPSKESDTPSDTDDDASDSKKEIKETDEKAKQEDNKEEQTDNNSVTSEDSDED